MVKLYFIGGRFLFFILYSLLLISCKESDKELENELDKDKIIIGVFGGSVSSTKESESAKNIWREKLDVIVETNGVGGAGFSNTTLKNIPEQITLAPVYDVYILWASTNDFKLGTVGNLDSNDLSTQSGGIRESVRLIKAKAPKALILFFVSMHRFDSSFEKVVPFIEKQKAICDILGIPYLDQFKFFDKENFSQYYFADKVHLNVEGYSKIAPYQTEFLKKYIIY